MPLCVSKTDMAWFTGIMEGEGSILYHPNKHGKVGYHIWRIQVVNTDTAILKKCTNILDKLNIHYTFQKLKKYESSVVKSNKYCFQVGIFRLAHIQFLIEQMLPYMVGDKKRNALLLSMLKPKTRIDGKPTNSCKHIKDKNEQLKLFKVVEGGR
jgi:hypothetical protein